MGQRLQRQAEADGESPGTRNRRPRRICQISLSQPGLACAVQRCTGSTKPAGLLELPLEQRA